MNSLIIYCAVMLGGQAVSQEGIVLAKGQMLCDHLKCTRNVVVKFESGSEVVNENNCLYKKPQGKIIALERK